MNRIKCMRVAKRMSQAQLADALHVNQSAISHWEIGSNGIDMVYIEAMSKLFAVPTSFLIGDEYKLKIPRNDWTADQREDYDHAKHEKDYLEFRYGQGYFESYTAEKIKPKENTVTLKSTNGKTFEKSLTDDQANALEIILKSMS